MDPERAVLSVLLNHPATVDGCNLSPRHFVDPVCRAAYQQLRTQTDAVSVAMAVEKDMGKEAGAEVTGIAAEYVPAGSLKNHVRRLIAQTQTRELHAAARRIMEFDGEDAVERAWSELTALQSPDWSGPVSMKQAAAEWLNRMQRLESGDETPRHFGLTDLDERISGMYPGEVHVVAGRPGMGKSVIALMAAEKCRALLWSGEMARHQLVGRMVGAEGVDGKRLRKPSTMDRDDWDRASAVIARLKDSPMLLDDTPSLSVDALHMRVRRAVRVSKIDLVVVDYLQLMTARGENRTQEVSAISRGLKRIAKDCAIPVLAVSQLSRDVEKRACKRPIMSDLRESGQLEQDAESITFVYRKGAYDDNDRSGVTELIVAKHRNGQPGTEHVMWLPNRVRFADADYSAVHQYKQGTKASGPYGRVA